jgi:hypothetical protein
VTHALLSSSQEVTPSHTSSFSGHCSPAWTEQLPPLQVSAPLHHSVSSQVTPSLSAQAVRRPLWQIRQTLAGSVWPTL